MHKKRLAGRDPSNLFLRFSRPTNVMKPFTLRRFKRNKAFRTGVATLVTIALLSGCAALKPEKVEPFEKIYLNDGEMELSNREIEVFEKNFLLYREAASGANGGRNGGGCGCN